MARKTLTLFIDLESALLADPDTSETEAQRVLNIAADRVARLMTGGGDWMVDESTTLFDTNGVRVGEMRIEER